jgi:predicted aminopeptidase
VRRAVLLVALLGSSGCWTGSYLVAQGMGQLRLLRARRAIADVLIDPAVDVQIKERLRLAVAARDFGVTVLGLRGGDAYTRYLETGDAPVAWNVSAAPRDRLAPHLHRFPIVGAVPYLGFFDQADARREEARLRAAGLDTWVRPVAGYSTLGFFSDPIYSSMLEGSDAAVVEVVLHEMLHGTVYLAGRSEWDEGLATFVGLHGAAAFFAARGDAATAGAMIEEARRRERDEAAFARWFAPLVDELHALYASDLPRAEKLRRRQEVFARARADYRRRFPPRPGHREGALARTPWNNAVIVALAVYHSATPELRRLYQRAGRDLAQMIRLCKFAVENERDPIGWLRGSPGAGDRLSRGAAH